MFTYEDEKEIRLCSTCFGNIKVHRNDIRSNRSKGVPFNFSLTPAQAKRLERSLHISLHDKYLELSKNVLTTILINHGLYDQWFEVLSNMLVESIDIVQPNVLGKDDCDITQYIKIQKIPFKDQSVSRLIKGAVLRKNFMNKKMNTFHSNPSLLLVKGNIDQTDTNVLESEAIEAEGLYLHKVVQNILKLDPSIIIAEGSINKVVQDKLLKAGKALVSRVKKSQFNRIQRCTQARPIKNLDELEYSQSNILGSCINLYVQKYLFECSDNEAMIWYPNEITRAFDPSLLFIESFFAEKLVTILISGPDYNQLQCVKKCLKHALRITRNLYLEREIKSQEIFLYSTKEKLWSSVMTEDEEGESRAIPNFREDLSIKSYQSDIPDNISLRTCLTNVSTVGSTGYMLRYLAETETMNSLLASYSKKFTKITLVPMKFNCFPDLISISSQQKYKIQKDLINNNVWQNDDIYQLETYPVSFDIALAQKGDVPLGAFLINKYLSIQNTCENCDMDYYNHATIILVKNFYVRISLEIKENSKLQKIIKKKTNAQNQQQKGSFQMSSESSKGFLETLPDTISTKRLNINFESETSSPNISRSSTPRSSIYENKLTLKKSLSKTSSLTIPKKTQFMMFIECSECGNRLSDKIKLSYHYLEYSFAQYLTDLVHSASEHLDYLLLEQNLKGLLTRESEIYNNFLESLCHIPKKPNVRPCCLYVPKNRVFVFKNLFIKFRIGASNPYSLKLSGLKNEDDLNSLNKIEQDIVDEMKSKLYQIQNNYLSLLTNSLLQTLFYLLQENGSFGIQENIDNLMFVHSGSDFITEDASNMLLMALIKLYKDIKAYSAELGLLLNENISNVFDVEAYRKKFYSNIGVSFDSIQKKKMLYLTKIQEDKYKTGQKNMKTVNSSENLPSTKKYIKAVSSFENLLQIPEQSQCKTPSDLKDLNDFLQSFSFPKDSAELNTYDDEDLLSKKNQDSEAKSVSNELSYVKYFAAGNNPYFSDTQTKSSTKFVSSVLS